jgi:mRNA-degrading endonuclease toxin of MazEF toxin-antitoxin module
MSFSPLRGEVYWIDFGVPRSSEPGGRRPAVVVQNNIGNRLSPTTIVAAVGTKKPSRDYPFVVALDADALGEPAVIHGESLFTVAKERLTEKVGALSRDELGRLDAALRASLGL